MVDNAVRAVRQWIGDRDDTLLLVTADHETGGFGFSYAGRPQAVATRLTGEAFGDAPYQPNFNYAPVELLDKLYAQKKSFFTVMFGEFDLLPEKEKTPEKLVELVNAASEFKISLQDATEVLTRAPNGNYVPGHPFTGTQTVPQIRDYDAFYVYGENLRMDLLGRKLATQQHITWGAGTHTSTPIVISAFGPNAATQRFGGMIHATDVGQRMIELLGGPAAAVESAPRTASDGK